MVEFAQVKAVINSLGNSPYKAGQFLYGLNGVSQIEIDLDDGRHVFLTVFDQKQIGAGDTVYQVANQIERPARGGNPARRFDTTLLINGLPVIQIEEKRASRDINEALNQMKQYIAEGQYGDIFSTLQILVAITPNNVKYMANTTAEQFNKDFAFNWQRRGDNGIVRDWKEFADAFLSIPMVHQMATGYMILDGTKNKQMLKVMRPYQVYATQSVIERLRHTDFKLGTAAKTGYIWHTTGSGKTITSFKTAWLASRLPNVHKVVFLVDRIALTRQTAENYRAYDPDDAEDIFSGSIRDTANTGDLARQLKSKGGGIIVTSVQKLNRLVSRKHFEAPDKNIVFIVDEAHRSTGGTSFAAIQKAFKTAAWVGYTGTPMFDDTTQGMRTEDIFGELLHAYTIREAIADRNVLGFKVDFETTIGEEQMREHYLPEFYRRRHPEWSEAQIREKIANMQPEDMDDALEPSFYDENPDHIREVVADIFKHWRNRSNDGKYNAILTTHVGGGKASTPMAAMYFEEFQRVNGQRRAQGLPTLKVAVTYSLNTANNDGMTESNRALHNAINCYNRQFGTGFGLDDVPAYTQDLTSRLNKTASDKNYLDLVIVVDQLLTGFDAPGLNTLYVDRTLKSANLIQAYSRTNRIHNMQDKPWSRIVNYRWPAHNEQLMNEALAIYANKDSAVLSDEERNIFVKESGVLAQDFLPLLAEVRQTVSQPAGLTQAFRQIPPSKKQQETMLDLLRQYNAGIAKLKQYDPAENNGGAETEGFDYDNPDTLIQALGMTPEQEAMIPVLTREVVKAVSQRKSSEKQPIQIELQMTHVKDVKIDYDYLTQLVEDLLNQVHENRHAEADQTREKIERFADSLENRREAAEIKNAADAIRSGGFRLPENQYPAALNSSLRENIIREANTVSLDRRLLEFRTKWGITEIISSKAMRQWFAAHGADPKSLNDTGETDKLLTAAAQTYKEMATQPDIQAKSKIQYRKDLRAAIEDLAAQLAAE